MLQNFFSYSVSTSSSSSRCHQFIIDHIEIRNSRKMSNIKWWSLIDHKPLLRSGKRMSHDIRRKENCMTIDKDQTNFKFDGLKKNYKKNFFIIIKWWQWLLKVQSKWGFFFLFDINERIRFIGPTMEWSMDRTNFRIMLITVISLSISLT